MRSLMLSLRVLLVLFLAVCSSVLAMFYRAAEFDRALPVYPGNTTELSVSGVTDSQLPEIARIILRFADSHKVTVIRKDTVLSQVDGSASLYRIGEPPWVLFLRCNY